MWSTAGILSRWHYRFRRHLTSEELEVLKGY
jgi:hypothetical protein